MDVGLNALVYSVPRFSDVGVRPEVENNRRVRTFDHRRHSPAVVQVSSMESDPVSYFYEPDRAHRRDGARERMDLSAVVDKAATQMRSDETSGTCDEDSDAGKVVHGPSPSRQRAVSSNASL